MTNIYETIKKWEDGEITVEEANETLKDSGIKIDPNKQTINPGEEAILFDDPSKINGYAMLDTGTGTLDKVLIKNGKLVNVDLGEMYATVMFGSSVYREVKNNKIV